MKQQGYGKPAVHARRSFVVAEASMPFVGHADWRRELRQTILSRVVPRLSNIGRDCADTPPVWPERELTAVEVQHFTDLLLASAVPRLIHYIDDLRSEGLTAEALMLRLLSPAARRLGDLWVEDRLTLVEVTDALGAIQGVMRALDSDRDGESAGLIHGKKVLLASLAGEMHLFGLSVVAAFFRRAGWDVTCEPRIAFEDLLVLVRTGRFTTVGLSVGNDEFLDPLRRHVATLRDASLNRSVTLLAGGPALLSNPDAQTTIGVDAVARDATQAVEMAEVLSGQPTLHGPIL